MRRDEPPPHPIGGKLEITYACNLRCGFCYTDSPRRTLQRTPELSDDEWLAVTDQLVASGAIEAVVTGGEPLLRRELTIDVCRRLASAGLGVTLNSNGWFIDDTVAAGLADAPGLDVHVSVDGPDPLVHDASRGVPGSWRRAVTGLDALIRHGVAVHAVCVVTEPTVDRVGETLDMLRDLGVPAVRVTRVIEVGAAAREGGWRVSSGRLERALAEFEERSGGEVAVTLQSGEGGAARIHSRAAPASVLVRPNGIVRTDSLTPFSFGHAIDDGLGTCWERVREHWQDPEITNWRSAISAPTDMASAPIVAYLDDEVGIGPAAGEDSSVDARSAPLPASVAAGKVGEQIADPRSFVRELALARQHRAGRVRVGGDGEHRMVRRIADGRIWRLNRSASIVFDALDGGAPADATEALAAAYPAVSPADLRDDAMAVTRELGRAGLVLPIGARSPAVTNPESTPDLPQLDPG